MQSGLNKTSVVKISAVAKQKRAVASNAMKLAKVMNDPLYEQYKTCKEKLMELKRKIIAKYAKKAVQAMKEKGHDVKVNPEDLLK